MTFRVNAGTVSAADFGNAGTAAVIIGTVTETLPGVFTVPVTPTSAGILQLKVNAGAALTDVAGNALVTTAASGNTGASAAASFAVTLSAVPASGNTLVAVVTTRGSSANRVSGISQTAVTWTKASGAEGINTNAGSGSTTEIWYGSNVTTGGGTTVTISLASSYFAAAVVAEIQRTGGCRAGGQDDRFQWQQHHREHRHHGSHGPGDRIVDWRNRTQRQRL